MVYHHHWQFLSIIFSHQQSKNASIIDYPPSSFHPPHQSCIFSSTKKQKFHTEKRFPVSPIKYRSIFFSFFLLLLSTNRYIESPMVNTNRGWITLACESWSKRIARFQGNWYRLRAINNASTRRQTEAELEISGLASANSLTGLHTCRPQFANNIPARIFPPWRMSLDGPRLWTGFEVVFHPTWHGQFPPLEYFVELMFLFIGLSNLWRLLSIWYGKKWNSKFEVFIIIIIVERVSYLLLIHMYMYIYKKSLHKCWRIMVYYIFMIPLPISLPIFIANFVDCIVSLNISFLNTSLTFDLSRKRRTVNVSR